MWFQNIDRLQTPSSQLFFSDVVARVPLQVAPAAPAATSAAAAAQAAAAAAGLAAKEVEAAALLAVLTAVGDGR